MPSPTVAEGRPADDVDRARDDRSYRIWLGGSLLFAAIVRFRWVFQPLAPDEGGYLAIARAWADGGHLYTRFWVDRPQGMMFTYRFGDVFTALGDGWLRVLAIVFGSASIVAVGWIGRRLSGTWQGGAAAAAFVAVLSSSPAIEGFTANGELLSAAFVTPGVAVAAAVVTDRLDRRWLFLAGVLSGVALSYKQSGYDGMIAICLWLGIAWLFRWRQRRDLVVMLLWLLAGLATFLGLLFLQGTTFGWAAYWDANVGFRLHSRSAVSSPQWGRLALTTGITAGISIGMLGLTAWRLSRGNRRPRSWFDERGALALCWLAGACIALLTGGNYHRHYWVTVVFPLGLVVALVLTGGAPADRTDEPEAPPGWPMPRRWLAIAVVVPVTVTAFFAAFPRLEQDARLEQDGRIASWVKENDAGTNGILLPVCGSASYHVVAGQTPPYPYLWVDNIVAAKDSVEKMVALLEDPDGPAFVARFQPTTDCDKTGRIEAAIEENFEPAATVDGVKVLRRREH